MKSSVLYIEDNDEIRNKMTKLFNFYFTNIYSTYSGKEALDIFEKQKDNIDLVITDINIPHINGIDLIQKIKNIKKEQKTFIFSVKKQMSNLDSFKNLGIEYYFQKPSGLSNLLLILETFSYSKLKK